MEKIYSFLLVGVMMVNFILMAYQERTHWKRVVLLNLMSMGIYTSIIFSSGNLSTDTLLDNFYGFIIAISPFILLFLSLKFYPSAKLFYLGVSLICFARIFGLPYNPDFGEKGLEPFFFGGFYYVSLLWTYFLFFHSKKYQKILFWVLSVLMCGVLLTLLGGFLLENNTFLSMYIKYLLYITAIFHLP